MLEGDDETLDRETLKSKDIFRFIRVDDTVCTLVPQSKSNGAFTLPDTETKTD